jgi:hypothetical protein
MDIMTNKDNWKNIKISNPPINTFLLEAFTEWAHKTYSLNDVAEPEQLFQAWLAGYKQGCEDSY